MPTGNALQGHLWNMVALRTGGVEHHINTEKERKKNFEDNITISFWRHPECKKWNMCCVTNWGSVYLQHGYIEGQRLRLETFAVIWQWVHYCSPFSFKSFSSFTPLPFGRTFPPLVGFLAFLWQFPLWLVVHSPSALSNTLLANGRPQSSHLEHIRPGSSLGANCQTCVTWKVLHRY